MVMMKRKQTEKKEYNRSTIENIKQIINEKTKKNIN